jgi:uncharacterized protein (TIGR02679 family)
VIPDDLASQVLVLGLTAAASCPLGGWLSEAAVGGTPLRITLHQLVTMPIEPTVAELFVCENPSVLRAAVVGRPAVPAVPGPGGPALGQGGFALVCTEGVPSAACHRLLSACRRAGAVIRWRGDFDWTGVRTVAAAVARYGALPWRMGLAAYEEALAGGCSEPLRGPSAASPWDPPLAARMAQTGRSVMEERLIPALLRDLNTAGGRGPRGRATRADELSSSGGDQGLVADGGPDPQPRLVQPALQRGLADSGDLRGLLRR